MKTNILGCKLGRTASKTSVQWADEGRIDCYFRVFGLRSEQDQSEDRHAAHQAQPWEQGAGRRAMMITQPQLIPGYHTGFLCWETKPEMGL